MTVSSISYSRPAWLHTRGNYDTLRRPTESSYKGTFHHCHKTVVNTTSIQMFSVFYTYCVVDKMLSNIDYNSYKGCSARVKFSIVSQHNQAILLSV